MISVCVVTISYCHGTFFPRSIAAPFVLTTTHSISFPIVIAVSPFVQRYSALLSPHYQSQIAKCKGAWHVYYHEKVYIAKGGPYCHLKKGRRSYSEHDLLLKQLDTVSKHVRIFEGNGPIKDHIQLFDWKNVVIGPHGVVFLTWFSVNLKHSLLKLNGMIPNQWR